MHRYPEPMIRTTAHRLSSALLFLVVSIACQPSSADTANSNQPAALALTARVSLQTIESFLRNRINGGQPITGRKDEEHPSKLGAFGIDSYVSS